MKRTIHHFAFYTILFALMVNQLQAQDRWATVIGDEGAEFTYDLLSTSDGGFLVSSYDSDGGTSDFKLIKLNTDGTTQWESVVSLSNYSERGFSAIEAQNGDFVVFGNGGHGNWPYAVRFSPQGDTLWTTQWSDEIEYNRALMAFGTEIEDGRLAMITYSNLNRPYLYLIESDGDLIEERELNSLVPPYWYSGTFTNDIAQTDDGGFVICGATSGGIGSAFIWKFDANADSVWSNIYQADQSPLRYAQSIKQAADGGFIVAGAANYNAGQSGALRTDADGNLLWAKSFTIDTAYTQAFDIAETESGNLLLAENQFTAFGTTFFKSELLELDPDGNLLNRIPIVGSDTSTKILKIIPTQGEGFVAAGWLKNTRNVSESDIYILKSDDTGLQPECVFDCVWPGDANNDGLVNMSDLMVLGLANGMTGPERNTQDIAWFGQNAALWSDSLVNNENMKYADCNGDGLIDQDDTLAIVQNYTFSHPINPFKSGNGDGTPIYPGLDEIEFVDNNKVIIPIYLGSPNMQVEDIYGMIFSLAWDSQWIDDNTVKLNFSDAWLYNSQDEGLALMMKHEGASMMDAGITLVNHTNVSGFGLLATLNFELLTDFNDLPPEGISINFNILDVSAHSRNLESVQVEGGNFQVDILSTLTGIDNTTQLEKVNIWPNPLRGSMLNVVSTAEMKSINIMDIRGRHLMKVNVNNKEASLNMQTLKAGTYIANIILKSGGTYNRIVVIE